MCDIWKREAREEFRAADLERHRESLCTLGVRHVVLTGGEPLLHSDLQAFCNFFREQHIRLTLLTTGLLLLKRAADVATLFDDIIVSLDGPEEIHNNIRRVKDAFQLIHRGIAAVRGICAEIPIAGRCTVQKSNHRHLRATVNAAKRLGLDSISFLAADVTSEAFNRPLLWPVDRQIQITLTAAEASSLEVEMERLIIEHEEDIKSGYILESADKLHSIARRFRVALGEGNAVAPHCNAPWVSAVVEVDGSVRPCFFHPVIGNIESATLDEVVNGETARAFRQSLDIASNPTCRRCVCSLNYTGGTTHALPKAAYVNS